MGLESSSIREAVRRQDVDDDTIDAAGAKTYVEVLDGPDRGGRAFARGVELSIGTASVNDLVLSDPTASRHHCVLIATDDGFLLRDLGSANGTLLGGYRIEAAFIDADARVQIGDTHLRFALADEAPAVEPVGRLGELASDSPAMRRLLGELEIAAPGDANLLLHGEAGTGRRRLAEAVHRASARSGRGFVALDCSAASPAALERELFGKEGGAPGVFEAAAGGTVFLAEVGDLGPELQVRLVRALEGRQLRRVGATTPTAIDVRVIASSRIDLRRAVNRKAFRGDLYDQLAGRRLEVPPLRERRQDLPALIAQVAGELGASQAELPIELTLGLMRHELSGNLDELRRVVERAVGRGGAVAVAALADAPSRPDSAAPIGAAEGDLDFTVSFRDAKEHAVARWTAIYVRELLARFDGNLSRAARTVSMDRNHLRDLLRKYVQASGA